MSNYEIICSSIKKPERRGFISLFLFPVITYTKPRLCKTYCLKETGYITTQGLLHKSLIKCGVTQQQKVSQEGSWGNIFIIEHQCENNVHSPYTWCSDLNEVLRQEERRINNLVQFRFV